MQAQLLPVTLFALLSLTVAGRAAQDKTVKAGTDEAKRVTAATTVFSEIMAADDKAIPRAILGGAEGIAVFPSTIKAGLGIGVMHGRGILSARTKGGWSAPAFLTMTGGSIGLQIGGEATDLILVISNRRGLENLVHNQFKVGADASAAAGPVGRDAQASTDIQMRAEILSYSRARGVFAGVTVNGSTIHQDKDADERFYGRKLETRQIVFESLSDLPAPAPAWLNILQKYAK